MNGGPRKELGMRFDGRRWAIFVLGELAILAGAYWMARGLKPIVSLQYVVDVARDIRNLGGMGWTAGAVAVALLVYLTLFSRAARRGGLGAFVLGLLLGPLVVLGFFVLSALGDIRVAVGRILASLGYTPEGFQALISRPYWMSELFSATGFEETELLEKIRGLGLTSVARGWVEALRRLVVFAAVAGPGLIVWWGLVWGRIGDWLFGAEPAPPGASRASAKPLDRLPVALLPHGSDEPSGAARAGSAPPGIPGGPVDSRLFRSFRRQWARDALLTMLGRRLAPAPTLEGTIEDAGRLAEEYCRTRAEVEKSAGWLRMLHEADPGSVDPTRRRLQREYQAQAQDQAGRLQVIARSLRAIRRVLWREQQVLDEHIRSRSLLLQEVSIRCRTGETSDAEAAALQVEPASMIEHLRPLKQRIDSVLAECDALLVAKPPILEGKGRRSDAVGRGWLLWRWHIGEWWGAANDGLARLVLPEPVIRAIEYARRDPPAALLLGFILGLLLCAVLFGLGLERLGRQVADLAFLLLVLGIAGRLWQGWRERRSERTGSSREG
jgi:hypothetical protein